MFSCESLDVHEVLTTAHQVRVLVLINSWFEFPHYHCNRSPFMRHDIDDIDAGSSKTRTCVMSGVVYMLYHMELSVM